MFILSLFSSVKFLKCCSSEQESISIILACCVTLFPQALLLVPVLVRTVHFSPRMVHVCAELVLSSTMNWISKALPRTVNWTASLRSVPDIFAVSNFQCFSSLDSLPKLIHLHPKLFVYV